MMCCQGLPGVSSISSYPGSLTDLTITELKLGNTWATDRSGCKPLGLFSLKNADGCELLLCYSGT